MIEVDTQGKDHLILGQGQDHTVLQEGQGHLKMKDAQDLDLKTEQKCIMENTLTGGMVSHPRDTSQGHLSTSPLPIGMTEEIPMIMMIGHPQGGSAIERKAMTADPVILKVMVVEVATKEI